MTGGTTAAGWVAPRGGAGQHPLEGSGASLRASVFWCLPDSSSVVFIARKFGLLCN
jgi:hypothetical protein